MGGQAAAGAPAQVETDVGTETETDGTLLGGRVIYRQFRDGYRTGIEPVLLAAAVPAGPSARVLEAGCGAGAALACLGVRQGGQGGGAMHGTGIERDGATAALARRNLDVNGLAGWSVLATSVHAACGDPGLVAAGRFDHAMANPPWHRAEASHSPSPRRDLARRAPAGTLPEWISALAGVLRAGGTLTLIVPAARHAEAASSLLAHGFGGIRLLPLWPLAGRPARIVIVSGIAGGRGDDMLLPGLVLHRPDGGFTEAAEAVLREGAALPMERPSKVRGSRPGGR